VLRGPNSAEKKQEFRQSNQNCAMSNLGVKRIIGTTSKMLMFHQSKENRTNFDMLKE
jgi:hypothetical protein